MNESCCNLILIGIIVDSIVELEIKLDLGKVQLGWWIEGDCSNKCSTNVNCKWFVSPNHCINVHLMMVLLEWTTNRLVGVDSWRCRVT